MNNSIEDYNGITAASIEKYLVLSGWTRDFLYKNQKLMVFDYKKKEKRLAIPASEKYDDFFTNIKEILQYISSFEQRNIHELIRDIMSVYYDRLEFRIISDFSEDGKLPLDYAASCIEGLKDLVLYSACAEQNAQPVCFRKTTSAKGSLDNFKLAQTNRGSFVINIDIKVIDETQEQQTISECLPEAPFEHKVVERISKAISQIDSAVKQRIRLSEIADNAFETGITANMCDALLKIKPDEGKAEINSVIRFASALTHKFEETTIKLGVNHFIVMDELARIYRDKILYQDVVLTGLVKTLQKREVVDATEKSIRLLTYFNGKYRTISMELSDVDYCIACNAHRDDLLVEVEGLLDMSNHFWLLTEIKSFKIKQEREQSILNE